MQVSLDIDPTRYRIHGYADGEIVVSVPVPTGDKVVPLRGETPAGHREHIRRSLVIHPDGLIRDWAPQTLAALGHEDLTLFTELGLEILILGTGPRLEWPDPALLAPLQALGIGVEVMDTHAACRTYNILMADQRRVAAALIIA